MLLTIRVGDLGEVPGCQSLYMGDDLVFYGCNMKRLSDRGFKVLLLTLIKGTT